MFSAGVLALIAAEAYFALNSQVRSVVHLQIGLALVFFSFLPALLWAKRQRASLPVFETLMFTGVNTYALPLLNGHRELAKYLEDDITTASLGVLLFQIVAICTYELTTGLSMRSRFWREEVISGTFGRWLSYGMVLNTIYIGISTFTELIPNDVGSVLRAAFFGIGIICTFIGCRQLGRNELSSGDKTFLFINIVLQCAGMIATLYLVTAVSLLLLGLVGYVSGSGRVPIVPCVIVLLIVAVLHHGKSAMRAKYWENEFQGVPKFTDLPSFFAEWIKEGTTFNEDEGNTKITSKLLERTSLFHMMCLVVSTTPSQQPFLNGETYKDIPGQFVPRFFWPNKPFAHVSTGKLSVYYGLQREEDTAKTTIGFGMLTEAYANFGFFGIGALGVLIGFFFKKLQCWAADSPLLSYGGLLVVVVLAWSFQVEFTLSIWLSSLYQACVTVLGIPFLLRNFFG